MQCHEARTALVAWVDGELSADATRAYEVHAASCGACRALIAARRHERDRWREALRDETPTDLRREILVGRPSRATLRFHPRAWVWAAAAAVVVVVMLIAPWFVVDRGAPAEPFSRPCTLIAVDVEEDEGRTLVLPGGLI